MITKLRFQSLRRIPRQGLLLLVQFIDDDGNMYEWAPAWKDVYRIFNESIDVERFNKPESEFLDRFAETVTRVIDGAQRIDGAYKVTGGFTRYTGGKIVLELGQWDHEELTPAFEVTVSFLDRWLHRHVEAFVINDVVVRLRHVGWEGQILDEHPSDGTPFEEQQVAATPDDLPF